MGNIIIPTDKQIHLTPESSKPHRTGIDPRLWLLLSPTLPVGGYSFSHGLESAVHHQVITSFEDADFFIDSLAQRVLPTLELPLVLRLLRAYNRRDLASATYWNDYAFATRETSELLLEESAKGKALTKLFPSLGIKPSLPVDNLGFSAAYALVCQSWDTAEFDSLMGYAWIWHELLVAAAVKLVPLGHSEGQQLLFKFNTKLEQLVEQSLTCDDDDIGASTPGLAMLSSAHETQYARQFRS